MYRGAKIAIRLDHAPTPTALCHTARAYAVPRAAPERMGAGAGKRSSPVRHRPPLERHGVSSHLLRTAPAVLDSDRTDPWRGKTVNARAPSPSPAPTVRTIPAWGTAPGNWTLKRSKGSPWIYYYGRYPGRWPGLSHYAPLALKNVGMVLRLGSPRALCSQMANGPACSRAKCPVHSRANGPPHHSLWHRHRNWE